MNSLPDKPSELIRVALADLERCEADPAYEINMGNWHFPKGKVCSVCLAGAVMSQTLCANHGENIEPWDMEYDDDIAEKLNALDDLRKGDVGDALHLLGLPPSATYDRNVTRYEVSAQQFKFEMRQLAADLETAGL